MQILTGLGKEPAALVFSPDGRYLAGGDDRAHHLWDLSAGAAPLWSWRHPRTNPRTFAFAPDGLSVVGRYNDRTFRRYDLRAGEATVDAPLSELNPLRFSPDGRLACATAGKWGEEVDGLKCAHATPGGPWAEVWRKEYPRNDNAGYAFQVLAFAPDSGRLARLFRPGAYGRVTKMRAEVFAAQSGEVLARWEGELTTDPSEGAFSPAGTLVVLHTRSLYAIDTTAPRSQPVKRENASAKHFTSVAFSRDGTRLATTSNDTAATVWDTATWEVHRRYEWQIGRLRSVCFAPDGLRCAAGGDTGQVVVWDLDD